MWADSQRDGRPGEYRLRQGRSQKFILGGYNFLLHDTTVLYTSSLATSAAISAQNNFQGLILGGYIYRYTPPGATPLLVVTLQAKTFGKTVRKQEHLLLTDHQMLPTQ